MSLNEIRNLDYVVLLCQKMDETWVSFRVGPSLLGFALVDLGSFATETFRIHPIYHSYVTPS